MKRKEHTTFYFNEEVDQVLRECDNKRAEEMKAKYGEDMMKSNCCDYGHEGDAVRLDTGGHSGAFLCQKHWGVEMKWRKLRNEELEDTNKFDILPFPS